MIRYDICQVYNLRGKCPNLWEFSSKNLHLAKFAVKLGSSCLNNIWFIFQGWKHLFFQSTAYLPSSMSNAHSIWQKAQKQVKLQKFLMPLFFSGTQSQWICLCRTSVTGARAASYRHGAGAHKSKGATARHRQCQWSGMKFNPLTSWPSA